MTAPTDSAPVKSLPATDHRGTAALTPATHGSGTPKVVARQGVLSSVRPDPHTTTSTSHEPVFFGLRIVAPPSRYAAGATAACPCGYRRSAKGRDNVPQLIADYTAHQKACPRYTGIAEKRNLA